jgi:hypothetical protein
VGGHALFRVVREKISSAENILRKTREGKAANATEHAI